MEEKLIKPEINTGEVIPKVDEWEPTPEDMIYTTAKGYVFIPVSKVFKMQQPTPLDCFAMSSKKCYNSDLMRNHLCHYCNYFEKYYDPDKELIMVQSRIKYCIDVYGTSYDESNFINDVKVYILSHSIVNKVNRMVADNYCLSLSYKNIPQALQYTDEHVKVMLSMSLLMNFAIPLIIDFIYVNKIKLVDNFILLIFDMILHLYPIDIYTKLYETTYSNVTKSERKNPIIWNKQDIRGKDTVTHSYASVNNIILNIMPKYKFDQSVISLNFTSINKNTSYQVLDIEYEFSYIPLSSSKKDEDNSSDFDKYESNLIKQNESLLIQSNVNGYESVKNIEAKFGPFDDKEIAFYIDRLKDNKDVEYFPTNSFQKQLIFNLFGKYFGDMESIRSINASDYVKLMIAGKKLLLNNHFIIFPYIISGKVDKLVGRKTINKKEKQKMMASATYQEVWNKYRSDKIINNIFGIAATIISSEFSIIDYNNPDIDGKPISTMPDIVLEESLLYSLLT